MQLGVVWVVLIALGAFVLGSGGGWFAARRARTASPTALEPLAAPDPTPTPTLAPATSAQTGSDAPDEVDAAADDETGGYLLPVTDSADADAAPSTRHDLDERVRYAQIIGIEAENASLRAVAARVPALERRIRELEATIHERARSPDTVLDLTGVDPLVPRDADVTSG